MSGAVIEVVVSPAPVIEVVSKDMTAAASELAAALSAVAAAGSADTATTQSGIATTQATAAAGSAAAAAASALAASGAAGIPAANLVANGDFSGGTTSWTAGEATNAAAANVLTNTGNGTAATGTAKQALPTAFKVGHVMYYKALMRVTSSACTMLQVYTSSNYGGGGGGKYVSNPAANTWYELNNVYVTPNYTTPNTVLNLSIIQSYADAATANGKAMQVKYVLVIDLTDIFGAGAEPSLAEMNALVDKYPNRWLGTALTPLLTVGDLYQNKLDRTNIRPTGEWAAFLEHEYRTTPTAYGVTPKLFSIDMSNAVYSSVDRGQTWKRDATLDFHPTFQVSNMNRRMLLQGPSSSAAKDARLRITTLDYKTISELTGIHGMYGCHSMDGKPGDDNVFVYAEYVVNGDLTYGVNIMQTTDAGVTWTPALNVMDIVHFHSIRFDPFNRGNVYATTGDAGASLANRWYKSTDSGATWTLIAGGTATPTGQTPLVGGTYGLDKYMRTTNTVMGVDTGTKGRNSVYYFTDNDPCAFMRFDKTLGQFQVIFDNLPGVAYGSILTKDGIFSLIENGGTDDDTLHYVKFPLNDADIDDPTKYTLFTVRMPNTGNKIRQNWSRQQDTSGGMFAGAWGISNQGTIGLNLLRRNVGIATQFSFGWTSRKLTTATLTVTTGATSTVLLYVWINGVQFSVSVAAGDTAVQVATKIRAATFAGYTTGGTAGTTTVTFTSTTAGTELLTEFWPMTTGVTGIMHDSQSGLVVGVDPVMSLL